MTVDLKVSLSQVLIELEGLAQTYEKQIGDGTGIDWKTQVEGIRWAVDHLKVRGSSLS